MKRARRKAGFFIIRILELDNSFYTSALPEKRLPRKVNSAI